MSDADLSDLFFNHQHPRYDDLDHRKATPEVQRAAIRADADEFAGDYPQFGKDGGWFADNFLARL